MEENNEESSEQSPFIYPQSSDQRHQFIYPHSIANTEMDSGSQESSLTSLDCMIGFFTRRLHMSWYWGKAGLGVYSWNTQSNGGGP